jgi:DNA-binding CsgD family transcriptional regulator
VSVNTVRTHIRHIYEKLQVQSRVQAARKAGKR